MSGLWLLAATPSPSPTTIDPSSKLGSPGFLGFVVTAALAVALIVLVRSFVAQLRKVQHSPEPPGPDGRDAPARSGAGAPDADRPSGAGPRRQDGPDAAGPTGRGPAEPR